MIYILFKGGTMTAKEIIKKAKAAFYGSDDELMNKISDFYSYKMDGITYPANSVSLLDCIKAVGQLI